MSVSHAILDQESRKKKAAKIHALVSSHAVLKMQSMLEVGTGSGYIAAYFSTLGYGSKNVHAVDVIDERQVCGKFQFQKIEGTNLPYPDQTFDFIISNHVIEHLGSIAHQRRHLAEVFRVLAVDGVLYFAFPNRWCLIEPHYRLPFLSYLPQSIASVYLQITRKASHYDCLPVSHSEAVSLLNQAGFMIKDVTLHAISLFGQIESINPIVRLMTMLSPGFWRHFMPIMPTLIFVCRKPPVANVP